MKLNVDSRHICPYSTQTREGSLYDKIDAELIEIFYRIKLNRQIHRIHVPPSNIKHIHV